MKNYKISIIIPIYNSENYLTKCLDSVCNQTYKNLEIICIDDGSVDRSGDIVDTFAKKDLRIKAIHQDNKGESHARNVGLKLMTGDYVGFMDCDDWIESEMYETMLVAADEFNVDIVASGWYKDTDICSNEVKNELFVPEYMKFSKDKLLEYIYKRDSYRAFSYMWDKLYKRELFYNKNKNILLFDENLKLGGDVLYLALLAINANNAIYVDKSFYHYYQRSNSTFHTQNINIRKDILRAYSMVIGTFEEQQVDKNILVYVKRFLAYHACEIAKLAYSQGETHHLIDCINIMKKFEKEYIETNLKFADRIDQFRQVMEYTIANTRETE